MTRLFKVVDIAPVGRYLGFRGRVAKEVHDGSLFASAVRAESKKIEPVMLYSHAETYSVECPFLAGGYYRTVKVGCRVEAELLRVTGSVELFGGKL